jgi:type VI secretion system protein ImpK
MTPAISQATLPPSLYPERTLPCPDQSPTTRNLVDAMHDGFYLLLLLKNGYMPGDAGRFAAQVRTLIDRFERDARPMNLPANDVHAAKYAFCAAVDEAVLSSTMPIRDVWECAPLQLTLFGDQLAGEHFFDMLDDVRHRGEASVQVLDVFYMCLLTGFQGKYMLDSKEKLNYLIATLDKEIAHLKGGRAQFAPHWKSPDNIRHMIKADVPMWMICAALSVLGMLVYAGISWLLGQHTTATLDHYVDVVKLAPRMANITISLP